MTDRDAVRKCEYSHRPGEDDALDAIEVLRAYADNPDGASEFADEFAEDAASEIRDLRERLEEVEEHRSGWKEHWREAHDRAETYRLERDAARRRADRLEEAVREATNLLGTSVPTEQIERVLLNALDSREDEGVGSDSGGERADSPSERGVDGGSRAPDPADASRCPECGHLTIDHGSAGCSECGDCDLRDDEIKWGEREAVHTDKPEGDEGMTDVQKARCIAYREGFGDGYDYARETDPPTDEPEGDAPEIDWFISPEKGVGATVRSCIGCGALIAGGPTRCKRCVREGDPPTDEPVSREGESVREKKVRFEKQCDCRSSASGPRLITSNGDATEQSVTFVVRVIPMACDRCDTPWTRTEEPTDE